MVQSLRIEPIESDFSYICSSFRPSSSKVNQTCKLAFTYCYLICIWDDSNWRAKINGRFCQKTRLLLFCPPSRLICHMKQNLHCRGSLLEMLPSSRMEAEIILLFFCIFCILAHAIHCKLLQFTDSTKSRNWTGKPKLHLCIQGNEIELSSFST